MTVFLDFKSIGLDKEGYRANIFLISPRKHMLWVLIRSASENMLWYSLEAPRQDVSNEYHSICLLGEIRKISYFWVEKSALTSAMQE